MRDGETGEVFMDAPSWGEDHKGPQEDSDEDIEMRFPSKMLASRQVARMLTFSSVELIEKMSLTQNMYLFGQLIECMQFDFGFVIPNSTNSWEQTIVADEGNVMTADVLSGNLICETIFKSGNAIIHNSKYRIYYDE